MNWRVFQKENMEDFIDLMDNSELMENELPSTLLWCNGKKIADGSHTMKIPDSVERPFTESDFIDIANTTEKYITCLHRLLSRLVKLNVLKHVHKMDSHMRSFLVSSLIVCGEQSSKEIWTTSNSIQISKDIHILLCELYRVDSENMFGEFETKWKINICKLVVSVLKPKLQKEVWKQHPASFNCYNWVLFNIKKPQISENLEDILPPALIAIDDFEISNQIVAINCLSHIIKNVTRTDLCQLGYENLIYCTLEPLLYVKEPDIITPLIPCVIQFLQKVEKGYTRKEDCLQFTRYDKVFKIILSNMQMEQYLTRRKAYIEVLPLCLDSMGLPMLRWSKQLLQIFEDYLFVDDDTGGVSTKMALLALKVYILHTWPMIPDKMDKLLEILLKLLIEVTDVDSQRVISNENVEEIMSLIEDCLVLVTKTSYCKAKELCAGIHMSFSNNKFSKIVNKIFLYEE